MLASISINIAALVTFTNKPQRGMTREVVGTWRKAAPVRGIFRYGNFNASQVVNKGHKVIEVNQQPIIRHNVEVVL